jgi:hypothetical protein
MARKALSLPKRTELAGKVGMDEPQWSAVRGQAEADRGRGRRPAGTAANLGEWGPVDGQIDLFAEGGEPL